MIEKFRVAFTGLFAAFKDKSVLIQAVLGSIVLTASFILKISKVDFIIILLCIGSVIVTEILNTCMEELCNLYSPYPDKKIKYIKDMAAGAVLFASVIAFIVGLMVFIPYI